ncbi:hypothetical protein [Inconstantimicrobium mannanitabidum]|uniref:Uncharacterized protein n=1 Tax=Inconstantimicrobium mannanitabidum TaxID=1604901 RepID=A0ACB5R8V7_9CLOT|nr:hypothetical protein [Clostridium sp. TW13]GKX65624.1 hypothetical protein rsdtw13_08820 [Clostridium sp. TW13]
MILAIDPGNIESAYVLIREKDLEPVKFAKIENKALLGYLRSLYANYDIKYAAIEMVASYGMAVGATVFETCVWIGRFYETLKNIDSEWGISDITYIYRKDEKMNLCGSMKAKDSNIIQALIDRFAPNASNKGKGTKKNPEWFYGFKKDIWQAYAVGVTYHDMYLNKDGGLIEN